MSSASQVEMSTRRNVSSDPMAGMTSSNSLRPTQPRGYERRVLVVDDNEQIHEDFRKVLCPREDNAALSAVEDSLFGPTEQLDDRTPIFAVDSASQGQRGAEMVKWATQAGRPYAVVFVDMLMPPGWDGIETLICMLKHDPHIETVICSAYSDYSWQEVIKRVSRPNVCLLPKPFTSGAVIDLAWTLSTRWLSRRGA